MGRAERIELRTVIGNKHSGPTNNGSRIMAKRIVEKYGLSAGLISSIYYCMDRLPKTEEYIEETVKTLISYAKKAKMNFQDTNYAISYFFSHYICPTPENLTKKITVWENKGATTKEILKAPEVLRDDVSDEIINLLSLILRKASIEPTPKEICKYISLGVTLDPKILIKKLGICLAIGASASDILKNYLLLQDSISVELLYAAAFEASMEREIKKEHIPGSLPLLDGNIDLKKVYRVIKREKEAAAEVGTLDKERKGIMDRYIFGPKANFSTTYRATTYLGIDKKK